MPPSNQRIVFDSKFYNSTDYLQPFKVDIRATYNFVENASEFNVGVVKLQLPLGSAPILIIPTSKPMTFWCCDYGHPEQNKQEKSISGAFYSVSELLYAFNSLIGSFTNCPLTFKLATDGYLELHSNANASTRQLSASTNVANLFKYQFDDYITQGNPARHTFDVKASVPILRAVTTSLAQFYQWVSIAIHTDLPVSRSQITYNDGTPSNSSLTNSSLLTTVDINRFSEDVYNQSLIYIPQVERYISMSSSAGVSSFSLSARVEYANGQSETLYIAPEAFGKVFLEFVKI